MRALRYKRRTRRARAERTPLQTLLCSHADKKSTALCRSLLDSVPRRPDQRAAAQTQETQRGCSRSPWQAQRIRAVTHSPLMVKDPCHKMLLIKSKLQH